MCFTPCRLKWHTMPKEVDGQSMHRPLGTDRRSYIKSGLWGLTVEGLLMQVACKMSRAQH